MFGALRSHPAKLGRRIGVDLYPAVSRALSAGLPDEVDLSQHQPGVMDQGSSAACEGHSGSGCLATAFSAAGRPLGFVPSPWALWTPPRAKERALSTPPGRPLPRLTDTGVQTVDLIAGFGEFGVVPIGSIQPMASDGRYSDVDPAAVEEEVDLGALVVGAQRPIVGAYGLDPQAPGAMETLCATLAAGIPVQVAFYADDAFEQASPGQVVGAAVEAPGVDRGHATYIAGYRTVAGHRVLVMTNSWGSSWCDGGRCLVGADWLSTAWELHPYAVAGVA